MIPGPPARQPGHRILVKGQELSSWGIFVSVLFWVFILLLWVFVLLCIFLTTEKLFLAATMLHLTDVIVKSHLVYVLHTPD